MKKVSFAFISVCLSLMLVFGLSLSYVVNASDVRPLDCDGCGGGIGDGTYNKTTAVSHSPVATSVFYSEVNITGGNFRSLRTSSHSDLGNYSWYSTDIPAQFGVSFKYSGFDSNWQQFSGYTYHMY